MTAGDSSDHDPLTDLTAFQRDILCIIEHEGSPKGHRIKDHLESLYEVKEFNHGRLYPILDDLAAVSSMLSDRDDEVIGLYDIVSQDLYGMVEMAEDTLFVADTDRTVAFRWMRENGNPDFDDLVARTRDAIADL